MDAAYDRNLDSSFEEDEEGVEEEYEDLVLDKINVDSNSASEHRSGNHRFPVRPYFNTEKHCA